MSNYKSKYLKLINSDGNSLTDQERFNLYQAGVDQVIINELDKEDMQYPHDYIQGLVKETLLSKNAYDKNTRWIRLNITGGAPGNANEQGPIFLDLEELKIDRKEQLIGYCNSIQFAPMRQGRQNYSFGEFEYTHTSTGSRLYSLSYLGRDILSNNILDDLTVIPITFKAIATILDVIICDI